jgi:hypothetical protein
MTRRNHNPLSVSPSVAAHEPDLAPEYKSAIIAALRTAWSKLAENNAILLRSGREEDISFELQKLLNEQISGRRSISFLEDFETVNRGAKQQTNDGRIEKQPDLTFRPPVHREVQDLTRWGWFVECKIINGAASVRAYRDDGIRRFSSGEYAAWMPSAAMLAYVRDGSKPKQTLDSVLRGKVGTKRHDAGHKDDRSESEHDRSTLSPPCVDIVLTHLWLEAP